MKRRPPRRRSVRPRRDTKLVLVISRRRRLSENAADWIEPRMAAHHGKQGQTIQTEGRIKTKAATSVAVATFLEK